MTHKQKVMVAGVGVGLVGVWLWHRHRTTAKRPTNLTLITNPQYDRLGRVARQA